MEHDIKRDVISYRDSFHLLISRVFGCLQVQVHVPVLHIYNTVYNVESLYNSTALIRIVTSLMAMIRMSAAMGY